MGCHLCPTQIQLYSYFSTTSTVLHQELLLQINLLSPIDSFDGGYDIVVESSHAQLKIVILRSVATESSQSSLTSR
jgi:hypothetical protein